MTFFPSKQRFCFTMIELLVTMGIIAVLLGLTTPAFTRLTRGSAVEIAARTLSSQLTIARAEAIRYRKKVALILPDHNFEAPSGDSLSTYPYTAYRLAFVTGDSPSYTFESWIPNSQWNFLPTGAIVALVETGTSTPQALTDQTDHYEPAGSDWSFSDIKDIAGTLSVGKIDKASDDDKYKARAVIFNPNGQCSDAAVLTFMEGNFDQSENKLIRLNTSNVIVQKIEKFSGRVIYLYNGKL